MKQRAIAKAAKKNKTTAKGPHLCPYTLLNKESRRRNRITQVVLGVLGLISYLLFNKCFLFFVFVIERERES